MAKQIKDELVEKLFGMVKDFDFTYLILNDLEKWKQGVNKEYLVKKLLDEIIQKYGIETWKKLKVAVLKETPQYLNHNIEHNTISNWFLPYDLPTENETKTSSYKLQNHASLKHGDTNRMS